MKNKKVGFGKWLLLKIVRIIGLSKEFIADVKHDAEFATVVFSFLTFISFSFCLGMVIFVPFHPLLLVIPAILGLITLYNRYRHER